MLPLPWKWISIIIVIITFSYFLNVVNRLNVFNIANVFDINIFIKDGSMQTGFKNEIQYANEMYITAENKGVIVTGLSKTCRLLTKNGDSLISVINIIGDKVFPDSAWYYHPVYKVTRADNKADIYFVKLHNRLE